MKTKNLLLVSMSFVYSVQSFSQSFTGKEAEAKIKDAQWVEYQENVSRPTFIEFNPSSSNFRLAVANPVEMMKEVLALKSTDNLVSYKQENDNLGFTHTRYHQLYKGVPVEGAEYIAHQRGGLLDCINGNFLTIPEMSVTPSLTQAIALEKVLSFVGAKKYKWEDEAELSALREAFEDPHLNFDPQATLVIYAKNGEFTDAADFRLAYKFNIFASEPESRANIYIDAKNGEIIGREELIHTADTPAKAVTKYSGIRDIVTDQVSTTSYRLRETGRGKGIQTMNAKTSTSVAGAVDFTDEDNYWNNVNAKWDEAAGDAHWATEMTYDYFYKVHGRNSVDGNGFKLINYVHVNKEWFNASWNGQYMQYGDGPSNVGKPLTAIDIGGHEMAHGVTSNSAGLVYQNESGALNESFSDIFGNMVEYYAKPNDASWEMGEAIGAIRDMKDPGKFKDPDTYKGTNWATGTADNGGVHTNSGVQNKWFYILAIGEKGTNDINNAYDVLGITRESAAKIAFRNLTVYLTISSNYSAARTNSLKAAKDIFGQCSPEYISTGEAWYAVGVGGKVTECQVAPVCNFSSDKQTSCDGKVQFTDKSSSGPTSWAWDFGDGQSSTLQNPSHTYAASGTYTVKLTATNAFGKDDEVKTGYITVSKLQAASPITAERCGPGKVTLTVTVPGGTGDVNWFTAQTGGTSVGTGASYAPDVTASTVYYVEISSNGCKSDRSTATVTVNTPPDKPKITESNLNLTANVNGTGFTYQWFLNGNALSGETKPTVALSGNGNYTVQIFDGKCSSTSDPYSFTLGIISSDLEKAVRVYPNPANEAIYVDAPVATGKEVSIQIYSVIGKLVYAETYANTGQPHLITLGSIHAEGIYFLRLQAGSEHATKKITLSKE
jgi:Zn-dependent metalloprotease